MSTLMNLMHVLAVFLADMFLQIPMADTFRSEGKIYVVVGVILILLAGFFLYLIRIDKRLKRLEKKHKH